MSESMRILVLIGLAICCAAGSGCASRKLTEWYLPDPITTSDKINVERDGRINSELYEVSLATNTNVCLYGFAANFTLSSDTQKAQRKEARDLLQLKLMALSVESVDRHFNDVLGTQDTSNLLLGGTAIGLTTAAAVGSGGSSQLLSGIAAGLLGFKALVAEEVYAQVLPEIMLKRAMAERKQLAETLALNRARSIDKYPVADAVKDALEYHSAGSFQHVLATIVSDSQKAASFDQDMASLAKIRLAADDPTGARQALEAAVTGTPYTAPAQLNFRRKGGLTWKAWVDTNGREAAVNLLIGAIDNLDSKKRETITVYANQLVFEDFPPGSENEPNTVNRDTLATIFDSHDSRRQSFVGRPDRFKVYLREHASLVSIASLLNTVTLGLKLPAGNPDESGQNR